MTASREKVLDLVASGKISASEGDELLRALQPAQKNRWRILVQPFESHSLTWLLAFGGVGALGALALSMLGIRFDGAIDVHRSTTDVPLSQALLDQAVAWPLMALVCWGVALAAGRASRLIDFVGVVGVARLPLLLVAVAGALIGPHLRQDADSEATLGMLALEAFFLILVVPALVWAVVLLSQGFRHVSGLRGGKATLLFTLSLVVAEILAKATLYLLIP